MSDLDDGAAGLPSPAGRARITPHALHGALEQDELAVKMSKLLSECDTPHSLYQMGSNDASAA